MPDAETAYAFLSYSRMDQAFAAYLARDLRARGIHLWFDQLDIAPGQNWDAAIHQALHGARAVLFVVSAHSVVSENVLNELTVALDSGKWVIPLRVAQVQVPLRAARLQRVDFINDYAGGLNRLVAHMQGGGSRTKELEAIAMSPQPRTDHTRSSIEPVFRPTATLKPRSGWLLPAMAGTAVGVVGLFALLLLQWAELRCAKLRDQHGL